MGPKSIDASSRTPIYLGVTSGVIALGVGAIVVGVIAHLACSGKLPASFSHLSGWQKFTPLGAKILLGGATILTGSSVAVLLVLIFYKPVSPSQIWLDKARGVATVSEMREHLSKGRGEKWWRDHLGSSLLLQLGRCIKGEEGFSDLFFETLRDYPEGCNQMSEGFTLLQRVCDSNLPITFAEALLKAGALVNLRDFRGETALHAAARRDRSDLLDLLLAHRAQTHFKNGSGELARQVAPAGSRAAALLAQYEQETLALFARIHSRELSNDKIDWRRYSETGRTPLCELVELQDIERLRDAGRSYGVTREDTLEYYHRTKGVLEAFKFTNWLTKAEVPVSQEAEIKIRAQGFIDLFNKLSDLEDKKSQGLLTNEEYLQKCRELGIPAKSEPT